jgi:hypothetical protein
MSFHSDDEKGLGDVVAALSLGSRATMRFRSRLPKQRPGRKSIDTREESNGKEDNNPQKSNKERRVVLTLQLNHVRTLASLVSTPERSSGQGDVLVMESLTVQKYYECVLRAVLIRIFTDWHNCRHAVVPDGFRVAATARFITPQHQT